MPERETGIPCFECGKRSGVDCPGRKPDEATRCVDCLNRFIRQMEVAQQAMEENSDVLNKLADS